MLAELIIADQRSEWSAAEYPVLLLINLLEKGALVELGRLLNISQQLLLADVQDPDLEADAGLAVVHQVFQAAPGAFQLLKGSVVNNLIQLDGEKVIDLRNARVNHHLRVLGHGHGPFENLGDKLLDQVLAAVPRPGIGPEPPLLDDLIE